MTKSRRTFIKESAITAAATGFLGTWSTQSLANMANVAPSDQVNVALIGCRNMGFGVLKQQLKLPEVKCVALCDVDQNVLEEKAAEIKLKHGYQPKLYNDFRKLLENKDIDAVIVGTPDHWHCLPMIYACEVGKDVYVEKPMANSIEECNLMVKAAKRYDRVVQVGQQQRSGNQWMEIMSKIKSGDLGKLRKVEIWGNFNYGVGAVKVPDQPIPDSVDYNFWLGPAAYRDTFNKNRFHGNWRMWWDYGGGLMTDWGVHLLDMALWAGDVTEAPKTVLAYGKNLSYPNNAHETYDTMSVIYPLDDYTITWEHTAGTETGPYDLSYGLRFICDDASIIANRKGYRIAPEWDSQKKAPKVEEFEFWEGRNNHDLHSKNFIECVKNHNRNTHCPPEIGRQVALYAHMANIAARTGDYKLEWDDAKNKFTNSNLANSMVKPEYRSPWKLPSL